MAPSVRPASRLRFLWSVLRVALLAYLSVLLLGCLFQRRLIYFPDVGGDPPSLPPELRESGLREVELSASDGTPLQAWHWPGSRPLTLLVLHGNAGHRGHRLPWLEVLRRTGAGVFIVDYRGYGGSGGSPREEGLYLDAEAAADWLRQEGVAPVVYVGESLGAAVAVELALRRPPAGLVLQSPFTSLADVGSHHYWYLPVRLLLRERYDVLSRIKQVACPVMVIHGDRDSIVPFQMGKKVLESAPGPREWLPVPGGDHNDPLWDMTPGYVERLRAFLGL